MKYRITDSFRGINKRNNSREFRNKLAIGVLVIIIMAATPFLFYLYKFVPKGVKTYEILSFEITTKGFKTVQIFTHAFFTKLTFVISFSVWYLTCKHWWKWVLLIPLTMFLFQLSGVINQNIAYIDEYDFWYSLPVTVPVLAILIFIRNRLSFYSKALDIKEQIDKDINKLQNERISSITQTQEIYKHE